MKVKEIMTRDLNSIAPDLTVREALALLKKLQISGLPVIDKDGRLLGMFTEKDVLSYILPSYIEKVGRFIYGESSKITRKKFAELDNIKVSQLMRKEVVTTREDVTLCEVAKIMLTQKVRRLPVLDTAGKVTGIIARRDVLRGFEQEAQLSK
jgi:predicted transcriptional regulator